MDRFVWTPEAEAALIALVPTDQHPDYEAIAAAINARFGCSVRTAGVYQKIYRLGVKPVPKVPAKREPKAKPEPKPKVAKVIKKPTPPVRPAPVLRAPVAPPVAPRPIPEGAVTWDEAVKANGCRFEVGGRGRPFVFCGKPVAGVCGVWCPDHLARVYVGAK